MAKQAKTPSPRLSAPQPKAQLLPQAQGVATGIVGIIKGRQQQIEKAAGYAADGMAPEEERTKAAVAAPPTLGDIQSGRSAQAGVLSNPVVGGLTVDPFGPDRPKPGSGLAIDPSRLSGQSSSKPGFDSNGIITADSAKAAMSAPMERSGGISGGIDMAGANAVLARENAVRQQMIDAQVGGGTGKPVSWQDQHGNADPEKERIAASNALLNSWDQNQNQRIASRGQDLAHAATIARQGITARGQDLNYDARMAQQGITARGQDLGIQRSADRNNVITRGQDIRASTAADRISSDEDVAMARIAERGGPSLAQQRGNLEIDAARNAVAGLTPQEIQRKTAKTTNTGRENPDFDPTLERAMNLSGRRKVGADDHFDQRQQAQQPAGTDGDHVTRFRADKAMQGHSMGKQTPNGVEVLDSSGKVIGHYR